MIQNTFRDLRSAVRSDDREQVVAVTERLMNEYDRDRARVRAQTSLARSARATGGGTGPVVQAASDVLETASRTNETKVDVDTALLQYLRADDAEGLVAAIDDAIETHDHFDDRIETLRGTVTDEDVMVPVFVTPVTPNQFVVPKGATVDGEVTIRNDTTRAAEDVEVAVDSEASLSLSTDRIDSVPIGGTTTITLTGTPEAGEYRPEISATVNGETNSTTPYLLVQDKRTFLEQAVEELVDLYRDLAVAAAKVDETEADASSDTDSSSGNGKRQKSGGNGRGGGTETPVPSGLDNKARGIVKRTLEIIDRIEGSKGKSKTGGSKAVDNKIGSVINQIEAFQNQIRSQSGKDLAAEDEAQLVNDVDALIDIYEDAQDAAV